MISIIAACDNNYLIGLNGQLPWNIPADLKRFKELTNGHAVIMGRKTFESLGSKPLPDRTNIVLSSWYRWGRPERIRAMKNFQTVLTASDLETALGYCSSVNEKEIFIIGGASLYAEALPIADRIYMTRVDISVEFNPDEDEAVFFPNGKFDDRYWEIVGNEIHPSLDAAHPSITFQVFERRK